MDANGQVMTLPGVILTMKNDRKVYVSLDNILVVEEEGEAGTAVYLKQSAGGRDRLIVKEKIQTIFSAEEAAKFSVEFGGAFIRGLSETIRVQKKLQGG